MLRCAILTTLIHLVQVRHTHGAKNETDNEPLKRSGRVFSILFVFQALTWTWCAYHHWWWAWFSPLSSVDMNKCPPALLSTSLVLQKTFILVRYTSSLPAVSVWTHMRTGACYRWVYLKIATELLHFSLHGIPQGAHSILSLFFPFFSPCCSMYQEQFLCHFGPWGHEWHSHLNHPEAAVAGYLELGLTESSIEQHLADAGFSHFTSLFTFHII